MNIKYKCLVCQQEKDIHVDLVVSDLPICDDCGKWLATLSRESEKDNEK